MKNDQLRFPPQASEKNSWKQTVVEKYCMQAKEWWGVRGTGPLIPRVHWCPGSVQHGISSFAILTLMGFVTMDTVLCLGFPTRHSATSRHVSLGSHDITPHSATIPLGKRRAREQIQQHLQDESQLPPRPTRPGTSVVVHFLCQCGCTMAPRGLVRHCAGRLCRAVLMRSASDLVDPQHSRFCSALWALLSSAVP